MWVRVWVSVECNYSIRGVHIIRVRIRIMCSYISRSVDRVRVGAVMPLVVVLLL